MKSEKITLADYYVLSYYNLKYNNLNHKNSEHIGGDSLLFVDRANELATLEQEYQRREASMVIVYGRRRMGKTALISHFIKDKSALYFLATEESEAMNREAFQQYVAEFLNNDLLLDATITRWEPIFQQLVQSVGDKRLVIVIDEFQYIGKSSPAFLSVFQRIWDTMLSKANVMVILCGSLVSMMTSQTLHYDSPLYGRRTAQIHLHPIKFSHYHKFFTHEIPERELVERYSISGGVPKYIEMMQQGDNLKEIIRGSILTPSSFLYDEPNYLLQKEVKEVGRYLSILRVIALGNHKPSQIAPMLQQKVSSLPSYFKVLIDLDLLEREVPVTETNPEKSKKGLYRIQDNYIRFWFNFVYPYRSYIEMGHPELVLNRIRQNFIDSHVSFTYERVCMEKLWQMSIDGTLPGLLEKVGRWWDGSHEIDVVGLSEADNLIVLGECKFWKDPVGMNVLSQLEQKAAFVDWHKNKGRKTVYVVFSVSGYSEDLIAVSKMRDDVLLA